MANLLLLKNLLPDLYKVMGTPSRVLIISPFKTPFGYLEAIVEEDNDKFIIENDALPGQFELLDLSNILKRIKDFSLLPIKVENEKIFVEIPKEGNHYDLIKLAKTVDSFIKDLYDFIRNILYIEEVKRKLGGIDALIFRLESLKEEEKEKKMEKAEKLKFEIIDLYSEIKNLLVDIEKLIQSGNYLEADKKLNEAIQKLGLLDHLRDEYKKLTGKSIYEFHTEVLRSNLFALKEEIKEP